MSTARPTTSATEVRKKRRALRWTKRILLGLLAFIVVAIGAVLLVLHTDYGRDVVRSQVETKLNTVFTGGATVGKIEGSPFGKLVVRDVVINGPDKQPAIKIGRLQLELELLELTSQDAKLTGLIAEDVDVDLRRYDTGELQFKDLLVPGPEGTWSVDIGDLTVHRAHVAYDTGTEVINLDNIEITGGAKIPKNRPLDATITLDGTWRERKVPVHLGTSIVIDPEGVTSIPALAANVGDVSVAGTSLKIIQPADRSRPPVFSGQLLVKAPRAAVAHLAPQIDLPDDIQLQIDASQLVGQPVTHLELDAKLGAQTVRALLNADIGARRVVGMVSAADLDITKLSRGKVLARAGGFVVLDVTQGAPGKLPVGHVMLHASGQYDDYPETGVAISLSSAGEHITTRIGVANPGLTAALSGELDKLGDVITLKRGTLVASSSSPAKASGGKAPISGALDISLTASGVVFPQPDLAVAGRMAGKTVRVQDVSAASMTLAFDARGLPDHPMGKAELEATGVQRGTVYLRELKATAANRADGKIQVAVRTRPKQDPWLFDLDALVTPGEVVAIDLQRHRVRAGNNSEWAGTTGNVRIGPERIELRDFKSASSTGKLEVEGVFYRAGARQGDFVAKVDANAVTVDSLSSGFRGTVDAHVDVERTSGRFAGVLKFNAAGLAMHPSVLGVDAEANLEFRDGKLVGTASAGTTQLGRVKLALDLDTPRDVVNAESWKRMHRKSIRKAQLSFEQLDLGKLAELAAVTGTYSGTFDGDLHLSATAAGGVLKIRDLMMPALRSTGAINADLQMAQNAAGEINPTLTAQVNEIGKVVAEARLHMPDHLFDPAAWRAKGRGALHGASVRTESIAITPGMLDRLGIKSNARGNVTLVAELSEAARSATLSLAIERFRGSPISQPLQLQLNAGIDGRGTTTTLVATTHEVKRKGKIESPFGPEVKLLELTGTIPLTMTELVADPRGALTRPLKVRATVPQIPAKQLLAVFGRTEIVGGTIDGTVDLGGTLADPTVVAKLIGTAIQVPPGPGGKPIKEVKRIALDASWDGTTAKLVVDGTQDNGMLRIVGSVNPDARGDATVSLKAKQSDLIPLLAFAPGPAGGAAGRLDADLTLKGLDARTARLAGEVHLTDGRVPLAPEIGTLRKAKIDVVIGTTDIKLKLDGQLGRGTVKADGNVAIDGTNTLTGGGATLFLRKVAPIGTVEPKIDADVTVKLRREADRWVADVDVRNGNVVVPSGRGEELKPAGAPSDMVFMTGERISMRPMKRGAPTRPIIMANVTLHPTFVKSDELRGYIRGKLSLTADGESVGIVGTIDADRGDLDLFGTRYQVERASVRFDGSTDPLLNIRVTHDFPEVTTITEVRGRLSKPELSMSSNPGTYSQGQLLGFLLGGEPGGDPAGGAKDRASSAGASFVANKIGGYVKDALPIDLDVLRYEAATSSSSAAITVGTWLRKNLFVSYRQRLEARPDENAGEGHIEYWLKRRVVLEGVIGDRNYNGVDLLWRKRY